MRSWMRNLAAGVMPATLMLAAVMWGGLAARAEAQEAKPVLVFAAASMKTALDEILAGWKAQTGKTATVSYAASSTLAKQMEAGAPADLFVSADLDWMDYVQSRKLIKDNTRVTLLGNRIVLVAEKASTIKVDVVQGFPIASVLGKDGRLAMGEVNSVPAGKYGKAALESLHVWDSVKDRIAPADSVRAALALVSRGETPLGIVYATDAAADPGVKIVGTFPETSHPPILYPVALTASSTNPDAAALLALLKSPAAKPAFEKQGFSVVSTAATN